MYQQLAIMLVEKQNKMKKGFKKFTAILNCNNSEMLLSAIGSIDFRTKSGITQSKFTGSWNGLHYSKLEFFATPDELNKIKNEIEAEFGVLIS